MRAAQGNQRVSARVSPKVYDALAQAADLRINLEPVSGSIRLRKGQEVIEKKGSCKMTAKFAAVFFDTLDNRRAPIKKLRSRFDPTKRHAMPLRIDPISRSHNRRSFDCGITDLNQYLQKRLASRARKESRAPSCW